MSDRTGREPRVIVATMSTDIVGVSARNALVNDAGAEPENRCEYRVRLQARLTGKPSNVFETMTAASLDFHGTELP
jgi:hypothetical protein